MPGAARQGPDRNRLEKFRLPSTQEEDHQAALLRAFPRAPAFREYYLAILMAGHEWSEPYCYLARHLPLRRPACWATPPYQTRFVRSAFGVYLLVAGFPEGKFSAPRDRARFPRPGSGVTLPVLCREWVSIGRGLPQANLVPVTNRRSFPGVARAHADCAE